MSMRVSPLISRVKDKATYLERRERNEKVREGRIAEKIVSASPSLHVVPWRACALRRPQFSIKLDTTSCLTIDGRAVQSTALQGALRKEREALLNILFYKQPFNKPLNGLQLVSKTHFRLHAIHLFLQMPQHIALMKRFDKALYQAAPINGASSKDLARVFDSFWNRVASPEGGYGFFLKFRKLFYQTLTAPLQEVASEWSEQFKDSHSYNSAIKKAGLASNYLEALSNRRNEIYAQLNTTPEDRERSEDEKLLRDYLRFQILLITPSFVDGLARKLLVPLAEQHDALCARSRALDKIEKQRNEALSQVMQCIQKMETETGATWVSLKTLKRSVENRFETLSKQRDRFLDILGCQFGSSETITQCIPKESPFDQMISKLFIRSEIFDPVAKDFASPRFHFSKATLSIRHRLEGDLKTLEQMAFPEIPA
jgi:hypothetical protein